MVQALIQNLSLKYGDTIREEGNGVFTINPRMVLLGDAPEKYKEAIMDLKRILTKQEIKAIDRAISIKGDHNKLYKNITERVNTAYFYRGEFKVATPQEIKNALTNLNVGSWYWENVLYNLFCRP